MEFFGGGVNFIEKINVLFNVINVLTSVGDKLMHYVVCITFCKSTCLLLDQVLVTFSEKSVFFL